MSQLPLITIISSERYPHHDTNTQQVMKNATALHHAGIPVELVIPAVFGQYFSSNKSIIKAINDYYNLAPGLNIKVLRTMPANKLRLEKFFHSLVAVIYCTWFKSGNIIYTRNKFALLLAWLLGQRVMFETYRRLGDESPRTYRFLAKKARKKRFVGMVLHSNVAAESMSKVGFPQEKLLVLHNGVDNSDMLPVLSKQQARQKLNLDLNARYVVYTGNMQKNKCVEVVVDIAAFLPDLTFLLVGAKPDDLARLTAYCEAKNVENVLLVERQPISVVSQYLYAADALIIPPAAAPMQQFGRTVLPFKLFPYLAAGRVIIAPDQADMRELLRNNENGLLVPTDAPKLNADAIRALFSDEKKMENMAANTIKTSLSLTWEARAERFKDWLGKHT